jgi:post-segregation antitoxin (ccd killing protein)
VGILKLRYTYTSGAAVPKRNLYVDDELDRDIRGFDVPLSAVCQAALRQEVEQRRRLHSSEEELAATARRLIADRAAVANESFRDGAELGVRWARESARWSELRQFEPRRSRRGARAVMALDDAHTLRSFLISWALQHDYDVDDESFATLDADDPFDRGVIEGATEVLAAVKPLVEHEDET